MKFESYKNLVRLYASFNISFKKKRTVNITYHYINICVCQCVCVQCVRIIYVHIMRVQVIWTLCAVSDIKSLLVGSRYN